MPHTAVDPKHNTIAKRKPSFGDLEQLEILAEENRILDKLNSEYLEIFQMEYSKGGEYSCPECGNYVIRSNCGRKEALEAITIKYEDERLGTLYFCYDCYTPLK